MRVRNTFVVALLFSIAAVCPPISHAQPPEKASELYTPKLVDLIPSTVETYANESAATEQVLKDFSRVREGGELEVLTKVERVASVSLDRPNLEGNRKYLPILLSALIPGAGELYLGYYKRGIALMAVEASAWTGYAYYHGKGLDTRDEYERFADAHWGLQRWMDHHPEVYPLIGAITTPAQMDSIGDVVSGTGSWPGYIPWVSKEEDKQHFYENIGKYDWYISGWEDFDPSLDPFPRDTPLRDQYRTLRKESNDQLDDANLFIYLSLATRVFSVVETILLTRGGNDEEHVDNSQERVSLRVRPKGYEGGEVALEYRFR